MKKWIYLVFSILIMIFLGTVYSYSVFRMEIEHVFAIGSADSGLPYMIALASYAGFMVFTGKIIEYVKPKYIVMVGCLLVGIGWILSSFTTHILLLTITYGLISGAGVGIAYGVPIRMASLWFHKKKGFFVGIVLMGFGLSPLITAPLARSIVHTFGVMLTFRILGLIMIGIAILLPVTFSYPEQVLNEVIHHAQPDYKIKDFVRMRKFWGIYLNFLIGTMIGLMIIGMTSLVGIKMIGISSTKIHLYIAVFAVFNGAGRPFFGWITDRFSAVIAMRTAYLIIAIATLLFLLSGEHSLIFYSFSFALYWFTLGGFLAIAPTATIKEFGETHYSKHYGIVFSAYGFGAIIGVLISGFLMDHFAGFNQVFYFILALCFLGIILVKKLLCLPKIN